MGRMRQAGHRSGRARRPVWLTLAIIALAAGTLVYRSGFDGAIERADGERGPQARNSSTQEAEQELHGAESETNEGWGELTEIAPGVFESTAGLVYKPGSREGHRIDHVLRHAEDAPERPIHGVFDGGRDEIFAVLDEAWSIARQRGPPVKIERNGQRTTYTIDMGRRVGYVGGGAGLRNGYPAASHIRLVLEDRDVITAFPLNP